MTKEKTYKIAYDGVLTIGEFEIPCYVLENTQRILSQSGMIKALGMSHGGLKNSDADRLSRFVHGNRVKPFINNELLPLIEKPIKFKTELRKIAYGYDAEVLQKIVRGVSKAYLTGKLQKQQLHIGAKAEQLDDAFSKIGLIALIDEATGYQDRRVSNALQKIFEKLLLEDPKPYRVTFPLQFYKDIFKLNNWPWRPENAKKKPGVIGRWTNDLVYARIAPKLVEELRKRNPKDEKENKKSKDFQFLTDGHGEPALRELFGGLHALAKISSNFRQFKDKVNRVYPKYDETMEIPFPDD